MAVEAYADSSFLVSLFRRDAHQDTAHDFMSRRKPLISVSPLNRLEMRNALWNATALGQMSEQERRAAFHQFDDDFQAGLLLSLPLKWADVFRRAEEISGEHEGRFNQRAIDLLHVAIALEAQAEIFLSFDQRQRRLAAAAGLKVRP